MNGPRAAAVTAAGRSSSGLAVTWPFRPRTTMTQDGNFQCET
jgi:hypothetical protein